MQPIDPVTTEELLGPVQETIYKLEVWDDVSWVNLQTYIKSVSFDLGSASMTPDPVAASWSAEIDNSDGIFHPYHPSSVYATLLRIGRQVRISIGGAYGGADEFWRRLTGYMDVPTFNYKAKTITLKGMDFMKRLADTVIRPSELDGEDVKGPSNWGKRYVTNSKDSYTPSGIELYTLKDALDPLEETNSLHAGWWTSSGEPETPPAVWEVIDDDPFFFGQYRQTDGMHGWVNHSGICNLAKDTKYIVRFKYFIYSWGTFIVELAQTVGGSRRVLWRKVFDSGPVDPWAIMEVPGFVAEATGPLEFYIEGQHVGGARFIVDWISVQACVEDWNRYEMPDDCNGPYWVELNGEPVLQGNAVNRDGTGGGWFYEEAINQFYFDKEKAVKAGVNNLHIYYYTDQLLDDVTADLLVAAGYYADRATALTAMNYTPTGITIPRVWFKIGSTTLASAKLVCERANYRFWFAFDGTPCFKPTPVAGSPVFTFPLPANVQEPGIRQDKSEIRNRIVIEGIEQAMFENREDRQSSCLAGEAFDQDSIDAYVERTYPIKNHLFQDQASIDAMAAALLAAFKDPKWYAEIKTPYNPVPLELSDTIAWQEIITQNADGTWLVAAIIGIIRNVRLNNSMTTYELEISSYEIIAEGVHILLDGNVHFDTEYGPPQAGSMIVADGDPEIPLGDPAPGEHALLNGLTHPDTLEGAPIVADVVVASGEPVLWRRVPAGAQGQIFEMGVPLPGWGRKITASDDPPGPGDGSDGDIWLEH